MKSFILPMYNVFATLKLTPEIFVGMAVSIWLLSTPRSHYEIYISLHILFCSFVETFVSMSKPQTSILNGLRNTASHGLWLTSLLPLIVLHSGDTTTSLNLLLSSSLTFSLLLLIKYKDNTEFLVCSCILLFFGICLGRFALTTIACLLFVFSTTYGLLQSFPGSLTTGESVLLSQCLFYYIVNIPVLAPFFLVCFSIERLQIGFSVVNSLIASLLLGALVVFLGPKDVGSVVTSLVCPKHVFLFLLWLPMCLYAVILVILSSRCLTQGRKKMMQARYLPVPTLSAPGPESSPEDGFVNCVNSSPTETATSFGHSGDGEILFPIRKVFHLLAGIVYSSGLLIAPKFVSACSVVILFIFWVIEWARRRGPPVISSRLNEALGVFRDSKDSGEILFTPIALLLGMSLPVWGFGQKSSNFEPVHFYSLPHVRPSSWAGIISIAVGDSVAALVGRRWGGPFRWPFTHRTIIGSSSSFIAQLFLWRLIAWLYSWPWIRGIFALLVGVLAEAYTEQIDNVAIPLLVMAALDRSI